MNGGLTSPLLSTAARGSGRQQNRRPFAGTNSGSGKHNMFSSQDRPASPTRTYSAEKSSSVNSPLTPIVPSSNSTSTSTNLPASHTNYESLTSDSLIGHNKRTSPDKQRVSMLGAYPTHSNPSSTRRSSTVSIHSNHSSDGGLSTSGPRPTGRR